ncbi:TonB-dependent receptor [bacterium]|nr:TonB-dependent receptor [bacterium]
MLVLAPVARHAAGAAVIGFVAMLCAPALTPSRAQETAPPPEAAAEPVHALDDIVVTGTRTEYSVDEAPVPVQVISRQEIEAVSARDIAQALNRIPGIYVRQNEQFGLGASTVRMQGTNANQVAVLRNGRRFRGGVNGVVDLRDIAVEDVERIEVIRGPASSIYGSDAMGGVINIVTREGSTEPHASLTTAAGTADSLLVEASHGWRLGPIGYFLSYQHNEVALAQLYGAISRQFEDSNATQVRNDLSVDLDYEPATGHLLSLNADYNPIREGPDSTRANTTIGGDWRWRLSEAWEPTFGASWYGFTRDNSLPGFEEDTRYSDVVAEPRVLRTIASGLCGESHLLTAGDRFRYETIDSRGFGVSPDVDQYAWLNSAYLQDEILIGERVSTVLGTSIDAHRLYGADLNPRLSVAWRPTRDYRLTGIVARGYRAPNLLELYSEDINTPSPGFGYAILGNPNLQPETDLAWNLQLDFQPLVGVSGFLIFYRHDFDDLIFINSVCGISGLPPCPAGGPQQVFQYQNAARALAQGIELTVSTDFSAMPWWPLTAHRLRLDLSYGYLDSQCESGCPLGSDGDALPFRPPNRFLPALSYEYLPLGSALQVWGEYEDNMYAALPNDPPTLPGTDGNTVIAAHWLWSVKLSAQLDRLLWFIDQDGGLGPALRYTTVFLEGQNIFDNRVEAPTLGQMGAVVSRRAFLAGVQFEL